MPYRKKDEPQMEVNVNNPETWTDGMWHQYFEFIAFFDGPMPFPDEVVLTGQLIFKETL